MSIISATLQKIRKSVPWPQSWISLLKLPKISESLQMSPTQNPSKTCSLADLEAAAWMRRCLDRGLTGAIYALFTLTQANALAAAVMVAQWPRAGVGWRGSCARLELSSDRIQPLNRRLMPSTNPVALWPGDPVAQWPCGTVARPMAAGKPAVAGTWGRVNWREGDIPAPAAVPESPVGPGWVSWLCWEDGRHLRGGVRVGQRRGLESCGGLRRCTLCCMNH